MRYDTKAQLARLAMIEDGLGGYEKGLEIIDTFYVNKSSLSFEVTKELFGRISTTALNCVVNKKLEFENNADTYVKIDGQMYGVVICKNYRNKTHLYLEITNNKEVLEIG